MKALEVGESIAEDTPYAMSGPCSEWQSIRNALLVASAVYEQDSHKVRDPEARRHLLTKATKASNLAETLREELFL